MRCEGLVRTNFLVQDKAAAMDDTSPSRALSQFGYAKLYLKLADFSPWVV